MEAFAEIASWERSFQDVSHPLFKACQASTDGFGEFYPTEVDVEHRCLQRFVARVDGDLVQVQVCSGYLEPLKISFTIYTL
jgi:hypothetical protein